MNTISIELSPQEASELLTLLNEGAERFRQANERMSRYEEDFDRYKREAEAVIARLAQEVGHVESIAGVSAPNHHADR